jgi:CBS domain-containing protein
LRIRDLPPGKWLSVGPDLPLSDVARQMRRADLDSVAVIERGELVGIVTERDLVNAIAEGVDPRQVKASMIMTANPATVTADEDVSIVAMKMIRLGIRHLPVVDADGNPIALISSRDLIAALDRAQT